MIRVLITGAHGFVGRNLTAQLGNIIRGKARIYAVPDEMELLAYNHDSTDEEFDEMVRKADFVFHLAGVNRPDHEEEFMSGNYGFTTMLIDKLEKHGKCIPIVFASSIQAALDNPYGISKKKSEEAVFSYAKNSGADVYVYRLPNLFGKWCRPNYNSVIATFCNNIAHDIPIKINDPDIMLRLVYIDDLVNEFIGAICGNAHIGADGFSYVEDVYDVRLGDIADMMYGFSIRDKTLQVPDMENQFEKKLYSTYLSYLPEDGFSYPLKMNTDERGSFTEILRTADRGQFSVNISNPGIVKGNHWHNTKNEKFVVVSGKALIQFRKIGTDRIIDYHVSGDKIEVVDIPTGYTHNIINEGDTKSVTFMWANECFDPDRPDTYSEEV